MPRMAHRFVVPLLLLWLLAWPLRAEPPVPLLWKVSDADNAVYLLGSFHLLGEDDYPLSADVESAFADAEDLLFELSPEEAASPMLPLQMAQAAMRSRPATCARTWGRICGRGCRRMRNPPGCRWPHWRASTPGLSG